MLFNKEIIAYLYFLLLLDGWIGTDVSVYKLYNFNFHGICSEEEGCTWQQAKQVCEEEGGYLATITSQAEVDNIINFMKIVDPYSIKEYYIGLNDIEEEGVYRWVSDTSIVEYNNFAPGKVVHSLGLFYYNNNNTEHRIVLMTQYNFSILPGQPDNFGGNQNCFRTASGGWKWFDFGCITTASNNVPLCEKNESK